MNNAIQLLDLAIKLTDLAIAGSVAQAEFKESVQNINEKLQRARDEGRDVSWDEVEDSRGRLDSAIERAQRLQE